MRLFLVISLVLALQACSSTAPVAEPVAVTSEITTTTATADPTTTTVDPEAADRAEIEDILTLYFGYAYDHGFQESVPGVEDLAISPAIERITAQVRDLARTGSVLGAGDYDLRILDIAITGDTADVSVCVLDQAPILDSSGVNVSDFTPDPYPLTAALSRTSNGWRVSEAWIEGDGSTCDV